MLIAPMPHFILPFIVFLNYNPLHPQQQTADLPMKNVRHATSALILLLCACSRGTPSDSFQQNAEHTIVGQCIERAPKSSLLTEDIKQEICTCAAGKIISGLTDGELSELLKNTPSAQADTIKPFAVECAKEQFIR